MGPLLVRWQMPALGKLLAIVLVTFPCVAAACSPTEACDAVLYSTFTVYVKDSVSGTPIASGARLIVRDGAFVDTVSGSPNGLDAEPLLTDWERAGIYDLTVQKSGYQDWGQRGINVSMRNRCDVNQVTLTARLQHQ